jgi:tetratricopeptide (TPR) repeat protein
LAKNPYYIEDASLGVYSLEELSYYIIENCSLLGPDFMKDELCSWIGRELHLTELSDKLKEQRRSRGNLSDFASCILEESCYCGKAEIARVRETLGEMENKSEFECGKIRGDRYMRGERYVAAIYEYRKVLTLEEKNPIMIGNVWHNLGTAYAGLFLFAEAAECYEKAYMKNENPESLCECIYACRCAHDESMLRRITEKYQVTDELARELQNKLKDYSDNAKSTDIFDDNTLVDWKEKYRRSSRL